MYIITYTIHVSILQLCSKLIEHWITKQPQIQTKLKIKIKIKNIFLKKMYIKTF